MAVLLRPTFARGGHIRRRRTRQAWPKLAYWQTSTEFASVNENRWFWIRSARPWKPRWKASFQRPSTRGISEQVQMVAIGNVWATTPTTMTAGMVGAVSPVRVVGVVTAHRMFER